MTHGLVSARAELTGVEAPLVPSYVHPQRELDLAAIEANSRLLAEQGFGQILCHADGRLNVDEVRAFVAAARRGCAGLVAETGIQCGRSSSAEQVAVLRAARAQGAKYAVVDVPLTVDAASEHEVVEHLLVAAACRLPILVHAPGKLDLAHVDPSGLPRSLLEALAGEPMIVGVRLSGNDWATLTQLHDGYAERYLIASTSFFAAPMLFDLLGARWLCGCLPQALHAPGRHCAIELYELLRAGEVEAAMALYWRLVPIYRAVARNLSLVSDTYENYIGFCQELAGGTRSVARDPAARVKREQERELLATRRDSGLGLD